MNEPRITPISLRFGGTSPKVADAFLEKIMKQCQQLAQFPRMGRERENLAPKLRSFPVAKFVIFYRPADDTVEIIRERSANHYREALSFYADYYDALCSITATTDERVIIVIGDRVLSRTRIHNEHITTEFLNALGWPLEHYYTRELTKKRIANLGGDGGGISTEHILIYRRPSGNRVRKDCQAAAMSRTSTSGCSPVNGNE